MGHTVKELFKSFLRMVFNLLTDNKRVQLAKLLLEEDYDILLNRKVIISELSSYEKEDQKCLSAAIKEFDRYLNPPKVKVALDIGSRDAKIAIGLASHYTKAKIYAFECNPMAVGICMKNIEEHGGKNGDKRLILIDKAISDINGPIKFYKINPERTITPHADGNIGASSIYVATNQYPHEKYFQEETIVESLTLKKWMEDNQLKEIDIIWMDLQGAELKALKGLGAHINKVKLIYTEVTFKPMYQEAPLFEVVNRYLYDNHFVLVKEFNTSEWFGDALYVREDLLGKDHPLFPKKVGYHFSDSRCEREAQDHKAKSRKSKTAEKSLIIEVKCGGLGDHLFWTHLPRIAKETGVYDKVYISDKSEFRHPDYKRLIWDLNPYIDGYCEEHGFYPEYFEIDPGENLLDKLMLLFGLEMVVDSMNRNYILSRRSFLNYLIN